MLDNKMKNYEDLLKTFTKPKWEKIGISKRAGVLAPLFSIYSKNSIGIGEIPDIELLVDWCKQCGMSIIQLLPMNEVGFDFAPYSGQSTFALDPMYLALAKLKDIDHKQFKNEFEKLKKKYPAGKKRLDYSVKGAKLELLFKIFKGLVEVPSALKKYEKDNAFWLEAYALFMTLKDKHSQAGWENWDPKYIDIHGKACAEFAVANKKNIDFHKWLQWQIYEQFKDAKKYANKKGVYLMGDLPFLVARDSADVWAWKDYFKLDVSSGAPPDMYFSKGQRWGMPTYHWDNIEAGGYDYLKAKVKYAEAFYDMFRIDHFVGLFRIWTIRLDQALDTYGLNGNFDPMNESIWEAHGRKILAQMNEGSTMLPCAEDLGVVPDCSYKVLKEFGVVGMDIQRWNKDWGKTNNFIMGENYRKNSIAVISSHDMSPLALWWETEAGTLDRLMFEKKCSDRGVEFNRVSGKIFDLETSNDTRLRWRQGLEIEDLLLALNFSKEEAGDFIGLYNETHDERERYWEYIGLKGKYEEKAGAVFMKTALTKINKTASIFSVQLIQDWLFASGIFDKWDRRDLRVNVPGLVDKINWSIVMPLSLEEMLEQKNNTEIKKINEETGRI